MTKSYMELCLNLDGEQNVYLRVPTFWDCIKNQWIGFIKTPKTQKVIHAEGKDSFELQNSFNKAIHEAFHVSKEFSEEIFSMFHPLSYWEEM